MHTDPSSSIVASKRFEGQAETGQDPYADDYFFYRYDIRGSVTNIVDGTDAVIKELQLRPVRRDGQYVICGNIV